MTMQPIDRSAKARITRRNSLRMQRQAQKV